MGLGSTTDRVMMMSRGGGGWMDAHGRGVGGAAAAAASLPGLNAAGVTIIQMNAKKC